MCHPYTDSERGGSELELLGRRSILTTLRPYTLCFWPCVKLHIPQTVTLAIIAFLLLSSAEEPCWTHHPALGGTISAPGILLGPDTCFPLIPDSSDFSWYTFLSPLFPFLFVLLGV